MALKYVVLTLLNQQPQSGYDIVKSFDSSVGYFWTASHQQVYRELGKLTDDGWVKFKLEEQSDKPDRKIYRLSPSGRSALVTWTNTPTPMPNIKETLLVKLLNISIAGSSVLLKELQEQRSRSAELMKTYRKIKSVAYSPVPDHNSPLEERTLYLALRRGMLGLNAHLSWLDEAIEVLSDISNDS